MHANSQPSYGCGGFSESDAVDTDTKLGSRGQDGVSNRGRTCKTPKVTRADAGSGLVPASSTISVNQERDASTGNKGPACMLDFCALVYNVRSVMDDAKLEHLFSTLDQQTWNLVMLCETWRPSKSEHWRSSDGHGFSGAVRNCFLTVVSHDGDGGPHPTK